MNNGRILIVEDEEDLRDVLEHQLSSLGAFIELAENGSVALEKISKGKYDLVVSDLSMPLLSGIELLRGIRERGYDTPFVVLTGFGDKTKAVEALRLGAFDFLEKPWDKAVLRSTVQQALELGIALRSVELELVTIMENLDKASSVDALLENTKRIQKSMFLLKVQKANSRRKVG